MSDLLGAARGRAFLLIIHDLTGLDEFDEIVVLDRGRVAERGTHARLITETLSGTDEQKSEERFYARSSDPHGNTPENGATQ
jgi:ABC-type transport system involved in Fe-S cluster assembly, permease and ATPase components